MIKINYNLYSVKMRGASPVDHKLGGKHISGAESIIREDNLKEEVSNLIDRALNHPKGKSDFINISIQKIDIESSNITYINPLSIKTVKNDELNTHPKDVLRSLGFDDEKIDFTLKLLLEIKNLKGALLVSFSDLTQFNDQIIRCTNMDYDESIKDKLNKFLSENNFLGKYLKDALALSSKICNHPNVLCEICISDDINYFTGYIASKKLGYIRIENFKPHNHKHGGRIIFIKDKNKLSDTIDYLKNSIVLINSIPEIL